MKIKKSQQDAVLLFDKIAGQLANQDPTVFYFYFAVTWRTLTIAQRRTVIPWFRTTQLPTGILPHPPHQTQEI